MYIYNDEKHRVHEGSSKVYVQTFPWVLWPVPRMHWSRFRHLTMLLKSPAGVTQIFNVLIYLGHHTNDLDMNFILTMPKCPSWRSCKSMSLSFSGITTRFPYNNNSGDMYMVYWYRRLWVLIANSSLEDSSTSIWLYAWVKSYLGKLLSTSRP